MNKLLFIGNTRLGDAVMSTGLLNSLCNYYKAEATVVCGQVAAPIFVSFPNVKKVIKLNKKKYSLHWFDVWKEVKNTKWDIICDLRSTPIIWFISSKKRIVLPSKNPKIIHRVARLGKINPCGKIPIPKVWVSSEDIKKANLYLANYKSPYIVIGPTANWDAKIWPVNKFAVLISNIMNYDLLKKGTIVLVGGPGEEKIGKDLELLIKDIKIVNLIGKPIMPTAAVFKESKIFVGNDSGLMHLSAAIGTPTLGLFGPTDDKIYSPLGKNAMVVRTPESPAELMGSPSFDHRTSGSLMHTLSVQKVESSLKKLLKLS